MSSSDLVSVIIIFWNAREFLQDAGRLALGIARHVAPVTATRWPLGESCICVKACAVVNLAMRDSPLPSAAA